MCLYPLLFCMPFYYFINGTYEFRLPLKDSMMKIQGGNQAHSRYKQLWLKMISIKLIKPKCMALKRFISLNVHAYSLLFYVSYYFLIINLLVYVSQIILFARIRLSLKDTTMMIEKHWKSSRWQAQVFVENDFCQVHLISKHYLQNNFYLLQVLFSS